MGTSLGSNWLGALRSGVDRGVRERGEAYFRGGAVEEIEGGAARVRAVVQGSELYDVGVRFDPESVELLCGCTCEYIAEYGDICKHIWATLMAANARGLLGAAHNQPELALVLAEDELAEDLVSVPEIRTMPVSPPKPGGLSGGKRGAKSGGVSAWQRHLEEMARVVSERDEDSRAGEITSAAASPESRIVYLIEPLSGTGEGLGVVATRQTRKKNGEWSKLKSRNHYGEKPFDEPDAADRDLLASLAAMSQRYNTSLTGYGPPSVLPLHRTAEYLARLCATGRVMLVESGEDDRMIPLRFDDGPPWRYEMTVEREASSARRRAGTTSFAAGSCVTPASRCPRSIS